MFHFHSTQLFLGRKIVLSHVIYGRNQGDFRIPKKGEDMNVWQNAIRKSVIESHKFESVHLMRPNFTTRCVLAVPDGSEELMPSVFRPNEVCDGLITSQSYVALGLTNGDCPAAIVYDEDAHKLALLHCGFKSLVQDDGGIGIFQAFFELHGFDRRTVKVRLAYGISSCCYGLDWLPRCHAKALVKAFPTAVATEGPEAGKVSMDLFALMRAQLLDLGLRGYQILREAKPSCTACAKIDGRPAFYSNLYERSSKARNLVLVWMEPWL